MIVVCVGVSGCWDEGEEDDGADGTEEEEEEEERDDDDNDNNSSSTGRWHKTHSTICSSRRSLIRFEI